ncbi:MAG: hypothetical protein EOO40_11530, partial [Deltaproteobacteria bacterium]
MRRLYTIVDSDDQAMLQDEDIERQRDLHRHSLWMRLQQTSHDLIYRALLRGGGEPFGAPFEAGLPTLTERVVRRFRQKGFFSFNSSERLTRRSSRNKFTRHGAAPHRGPYHYLPQVKDARGFVGRFLAYLRAHGFTTFI